MLPTPSGFGKVYNEGRRRPSLIAAWAGGGAVSVVLAQRGAPAPLPHCGDFAGARAFFGGVQRGAPAPLPHCGVRHISITASSECQRGAPAPLPHCGVCRVTVVPTICRPTRGAGAPPSLRPAMPSNDASGFVCPTRGAGAPPSLRPAGTMAAAVAEYEQRGAPAPLPHCGTGQPSGWRVIRSQRGAPAPLPHCGMAWWAGNRAYFICNEGRRRPSLIAARRFPFRRGRVRRNEGRRRPSLIAAPCWNGGRVRG